MKNAKHVHMPEDINKYYNMKVEVFEDEQFHICHDGRELRHIRTETKEQNGYTDETLLRRLQWMRT